MDIHQAVIRVTYTPGHGWTVGIEEVVAHPGDQAHTVVCSGMKVGAPLTTVVDHLHHWVQDVQSLAEATER